MSAIRKRLVCIECTRRKIRCDKVLPCRNCTRKGIACSRSDKTQHDSIVELLQARVQHLEATVQEMKQDKTAPSTQQKSASDRDQDRDHDPDPSSDVGDAATILEFLAWGRRKNLDYGDFLPSPGDVTTGRENEQGHYKASVLEGGSTEPYVQSILPHRAFLRRLVTFHCEQVLWYHNSFDADRFQQKVESFFQVADGQVGHPSVDYQWLALLFAILCGALACTPRQLAQTWDLTSSEQTSLAQRWFKAVSLCLHRGDYMTCHSGYPIQAVGTLTMSAHLLGFSNSLSVLIASVARIGQCMGLHQTSTPSGAWRQLCIQDWFSIPFFESYIINRPSRADLDADEPKHDLPTEGAYSHFFYKVAAVLSSSHDAMQHASTLYTRYEQVLEHDRWLRSLATEHLPLFLQNGPIDPAWPAYVPWARRCLAISLSHKVIMIHRKFLAPSFTNPLFTRTRRTCVAAARTIIKEQKEARNDGGPVLWIQQAFGVTASIILCLDLFHRARNDTEAAHHRQLINDGLKMLADGPQNMIATRGVHLLEALLAREPQHHSEPDLAGIVRESESIAGRRESFPWPPGSGQWSDGNVDHELRGGHGDENETLRDILALAASYI
ncbi:uncharacterized protein BDV14DRAFT_208371 [Aspergillus stella-maris]|uniref:uncharacterized protein n=1 Tax=Aspergillus stella-maris TaxID=1810926 RepID=UPI003CCE3C60